MFVPPQLGMVDSLLFVRCGGAGRPLRLLPGPQPAVVFSTRGGFSSSVSVSAPCGVDTPVRVVRVQSTPEPSVESENEGAAPPSIKKAGRKRAAPGKVERIKSSSGSGSSSTNSAKSRKKVVVIGGGWSGFGACLHLSRTEGVDVVLYDAAAEPGTGLMKSEGGRDVEPGTRGFWYDYPNINALVDTLGISPFTEYLTSGFWEKSGTSSKLITEAPVFSAEKLKLPTILGQYWSTAPKFYNLPIADRVSMIPFLKDWLVYNRDQETYEMYDRMTSRELFERSGMSARAFNRFIAPTLAVGLFAPPHELSAAVVLELLDFYALRTTPSFDVRWSKGPIAKRIFEPLVACIVENGGKIQGSSFVSRVDTKDDGSVELEVLVGSKDKAKKQLVKADAVIFATSIKGTKSIVAASPALGARPEFARIGSLRSIDAIATKLWFEGRIPTRFPANVVIGDDVASLGMAAHTYFAIPGDEEEGVTAISSDFYGSSSLMPLSDDDIVKMALDSITKCDRAFKDAKLVDRAVLRFPQAVTHFSPGSYMNRPEQATSHPSLFIAGDYVRGALNGALGLSQERAYVTGLNAANLALTTRLGFGDRATARILPTADDELHIKILREALVAAERAKPRQSTF